MTITMVQIQLRDCDYAIAMPGMAHRAVPGIDRNGLLPSKGNRATRDIRKTAAHEA
jgi:hypothetical protein